MTFPNRWKHSVNIKVFLHDASLTLEQKGQRVADALRPFHVFADATDELINAGADGDVEWFDGCLSDIYDIADDERVWLGL